MHFIYYDSKANLLVRLPSTAGGEELLDGGDRKLLVGLTSRIRCDGVLL
jgi:hypothetical protein